MLPVFNYILETESELENGPKIRKMKATIVSLLDHPYPDDFIILPFYSVFAFHILPFLSIFGNNWWVTMSHNKMSMMIK